MCVASSLSASVPFPMALSHGTPHRWRDQSVGQLDWGAFLEAKRQELTRLNSVYKDNLSK